MKNLILASALILAMRVAAQEGAVPADQEPLRKVELKNDCVEVMHVTIPAGQSSQWHRHSHDAIVVGLSDAAARIDVQGQNAASFALHPGDVSARPYANQPVTHRVNNVGKTPFETLEIELLKRPEGPAADPATAPAAENASLRAYQWALDPGHSTPQHTHVRPYLIIAATPMQLLMKAPDGASMEHPIRAGDFHWIDAQVTHTLTNTGKESGTIIEVELK